MRRLCLLYIRRAKPKLQSREAKHNLEYRWGGKCSQLYAVTVGIIKDLKLTYLPLL